MLVSLWSMNSGSQITSLLQSEAAHDGNTVLCARYSSIESGVGNRVIATLFGVLFSYEDVIVPFSQLRQEF